MPVNKRREHFLVYNFVLCYNFIQWLLSWGHDREKGEENVAEVNINIAGMNAFLFPTEFYILAGKCLHYSIFDDIVTLHH